MYKPYYFRISGKNTLWHSIYFFKYYYYTRNGYVVVKIAKELRKVCSGMYIPPIHWRDQGSLGDACESVPCILLSGCTRNRHWVQPTSHKQQSVKTNPNISKQIMDFIVLPQKVFLILKILLVIFFKKQQVYWCCAMKNLWKSLFIYDFPRE